MAQNIFEQELIKVQEKAQEALSKVQEERLKALEKWNNNVTENVRTFIQSVLDTELKSLPVDSTKILFKITQITVESSKLVLTVVVDFGSWFSTTYTKKFQLITSDDFSSFIMYKTNKESNSTEFCETAYIDQNVRFTLKNRAEFGYIYLSELFGQKAKTNVPYEYMIDLIDLPE